MVVEGHVEMRRKGGRNEPQSDRMIHDLASKKKLEISEQSVEFHIVATLARAKKP
jgi:hypothetical protein